MLTFRLQAGQVVQTEPDGSVTRFDPKSWGAFTRGSLVVHAVRIPRRFKVGADVCKDGYLVFDGRLYATDAASFSRYYSALSTVAKAA